MIEKNNIVPISVSVSSSDRRGVQGTAIIFRCSQVPEFQYPHRIVGGFKTRKPDGLMSQSRVSVSSSDRRGVQVYLFRCRPLFFEVSVSSSDRRGVQVGLPAPVADSPQISFSILIGSSGGSSTIGQRVLIAEDEVSVSSSDRRGVQVLSICRSCGDLSVSVSSSDRRGVQVGDLKDVPQWLPSFSILIGSSGGSSWY